ncbi:MAG TPA: hypothetical protein VEI97_13360 [bacterium]|nr:hypothetical protein [bacterium]
MRLLWPLAVVLLLPAVVPAATAAPSSTERRSAQYAQARAGRLPARQQLGAEIFQFQLNQVNRLKAMAGDGYVDPQIDREQGLFLFWPGYHKPVPLVLKKPELHTPDYDRAIWPERTDFGTTLNLPLQGASSDGTPLPGGIRRWAITLGDPAPPLECFDVWSTSPDGVPLHPSSGEGRQVAHRLRNGTVVKVLSVDPNNGWRLVQEVDGKRKGWIIRECLGSPQACSDRLERADTTDLGLIAPMLMLVRRYKEVTGNTPQGLAEAQEFFDLRLLPAAQKRLKRQYRMVFIRVQGLTVAAEALSVGGSRFLVLDGQGQFHRPKDAQAGGLTEETAITVGDLLEDALLNIRKDQTPLPSMEQTGEPLPNPWVPGDNEDETEGGPGGSQR